MGRKTDIKIANISILNFIKSPRKKSKKTILDNLVIILKDSLVGVISDINSNNLPTVKCSL